MSDVAKQSDLQTHISADWKIVHAIWKNIKAKLPYYVRAIGTAFTPTKNGSVWQTVTVSAAPDNAKVILCLQVHMEAEAATDWFFVKFRRYGSSETYESEVAGGGLWVNATSYPDSAGYAEVELSTDKKYQYLHDASGYKVRSIKQLGYWVIPS